MAREIKFRGKNQQGKWIIGEILSLNKHKYIAPQDGDWFDFIPWVDNNVFHAPNSDEYEVKQDTIGQYTGLHDKNNKEIYEGDILRKSTFVDNDFTETYLDRDTIGVVRILPSCGTTICDCIVYETDDPYKEKKMKERIKRAHVVGKRCEIIGNIYDDPELLKTE